MTTIALMILGGAIYVAGGPKWYDCGLGYGSRAKPYFEPSFGG